MVRLPPVRFSVFVAALAAVSLARAQAPVPEGLDEVVLGARKHAHTDMTVNGHAFRAIRSYGTGPVLAWNADPEKPLDLPLDRTRALVWLTAAAKGLEHGDFRPRFRRQSKEFGMDVLTFDLWRKDVRLLDYWVAMYWRGGRFVGMFNHVPVPVTGVDEPSDADRKDPDRVYFAQRDAQQRYRLVLATLARTKTATHDITAVTTKDGVAYELYEQHAAFEPPLGSAEFTEYSVPVGTFPDQIWTDSTGIVWFSQPTSNYVTSLDPKTSKFQQYATTGGRGADGFWIDDQDRAWTGLYYTANLGRFDIPTKVFTAIAAPYTPANLAIPCGSGRGTIWVTDHAQNKISEYDPKAQKWLGTYVMPISRTWVVAGVTDPARGTMWFTGTYSNTLPFKDVGQPIGNVNVPSAGGPAFLAFHDDKVWASLWNANRIVEYDVVTKKLTEYAFRTGEFGGPLSISPDGRPVCGTRTGGQGYIVIFDPTSKTFTEYKIPSSTGLKDGLTVAQDGAIWFTGTYTNKVGVLRVK